MKKKITLFFTLLLCLFYIEGNAQTQFWSDTFEDSGAPSIGSRTPSIAEFSCGGTPATAYFMRSQASDLSIQNTPFIYSAFQGSKFWAAEDIDKGPTCTNSSIPANQQVTWSGINIFGKTGLSFKGLFAADNLGGWQGINWGSAQDFLAVEYRIDGGAWIKAIAFYSKEPANSVASQYTLDLDTDGDMIGDGASLNYTFTEYSVNIPQTGTTLDLRFNCFANANVSQELAIDNFRLFEAPAGVLLSTSPTLTFTQNSSDITGDNIASDGEGGSQAISDIDLQIYNISDTNGTLSSPLSWQNNSYLSSSTASYTALTNQNNGGSKGMIIKSADGSEFKLNQFDYYNWGESSSLTNTIKGYKNGSEVASTTFQGYNSGYNPFTVTLDATFQNVDEVRFYISAGGYLGDQSATNHSINKIKVSPPITCTTPTITGNPPNRTICIGTNTTFPITATAAISYQWQVNTGSGFTDIINGGVYSNVTTNTLTIIGATAGMSGYLYRCKAINSSCTTNTNSATLTVSNPSLSAASQTNVSCFGGSNGTATVNAATGGISPYGYSWSPSGGTGTTASGLTPTTYTCTVTDANSCTATQSFTITQPAALTATTSQTNVSCNGGSNGTASVTASGGTLGYTYSWSPSGGSAATASGLAASATAYVCTITDANSCTTTKSFTITQPSAIALTAASQTNIACFGGSSAAATVNTATGGAGSYTYNWTPGNPTGDGTVSVSGLTAGTWTCTVTDANSCTATRGFTVTQPSALVLTAASQTNNSCNAGSNGAASVNTATGGAGSYTYDWTPGIPTGDGTTAVSGLTAGTWTCTVTDANGCTKTQSFTVTQPSAIALTAASQTNIACFGGSNGAATINTPTGGAGSYTYNWTPGNPTGDGTASVSGLTAGTWTCTVTDANSCTATQSFTVTQPTALTATTSQTNVSCNGGSNGTASVIVSGGTSGYFYSWSPSGGTSSTASGLSAGTYVCTITDANSCTVTKNFTVTQPPAIALTAASQTNIACFGGSSGAATVNTATGGSGGYTYNWTPGNPTGDGTTSVSGLTAGTWTCTVTDANSCSATRSFTVTQPSALVLTVASQTNNACNTGSTGAATVNAATGGAGGYTYNWTPGNPTGDGTTSVSGLTAGTWTCTVTDINSCTTSQSFTVTEPTQLSFTTTNLPVYDFNVAYSESIMVTGGTGAKTYAVATGSLPSGFNLLSNGTITGTSNQIADSNFTVTATDANNCSNSQAFILKLSQIPITVTATSSQTKVYGESDTVLSYIVTPSLLPGDSFSGSLDRVIGENVGDYTINQGSLTAGTKYLITYVGADFSITAKPIMVTADASQTKVYGTVDPVFAYSVSPNLVGNDTFTGALTRVAGNNVGAYAIQQGDLSAGSNYMITYVSKDFDITAQSITITANASQTKVYGTVDTTFTYSVSPSLVSGDSFTGELTRVAGNNVGAYAIEQGNLTAGSNYMITYVGENFTVTAKPITVTAAASQTKVYGTVDPIFTYSVSPSLVSGDLFTGALTRAAGSNVGTYPIEQGNLTAGSNYMITYVGKNFEITTQSITVTANASQAKVYGTVDPVFTYSVSPSLVSGDSFTGALTRATGSNVGTYAILQGTLNAGTNYVITYLSKDFSITKADQVITWNQSLALGCDGENTLILTATSSSGLLINYVSSNSNVATIINGSLIFQNYGLVTITASQLGDNNYNPSAAVVLPVLKSVPNLIRKQFDNIIFFDNSSKSYKAYKWYKNGVLVPSQTAQYFKENGSLNGSYYAVATKLDGTFVITCPLILSPTIEEEYIKIVPNPVKSNSDYQLVTNVSLPRLQNAHIQIYNIAGLLLEDKIITENMVTLKSPSVEGIYIINMTLSTGKYFTKNLLVKN